MSEVIKTRDDFFRVLAATTAELDDLAAREPAYQVWISLQRQLHAMAQWTRGGATPTPEQRGMISIGLLAARELEPAPDKALQDLIDRLHNLNNFWRHWPA